MNSDINNMSERDLILALIKKTALQEKKIEELTETVKELITYIGNFNEPMSKANVALDKEDDHGIYQMFRNITTKFAETNYHFNEFYTKYKNEVPELVSRSERVAERTRNIDTKLDRMQEDIKEIKRKIDKMN